MSENFKRVATIKDGIVQNVFVFSTDEEQYNIAMDGVKSLFSDHIILDCSDWKDPEEKWTVPSVGWEYDGKNIIAPKYEKGPVTEESLAEAARLLAEAEERRKNTVDENATQGVTN